MAPTASERSATSENASVGSGTRRSGVRNRCPRDFDWFLVLALTLSANMFGLSCCGSRKIEGCSSDVSKRASKYRAKHDAASLEWLAANFLEKGMARVRIESVMGPIEDCGELMHNCYKCSRDQPWGTILQLHFDVLGTLDDWEWLSE